MSIDEGGHEGRNEYTVSTRVMEIVTAGIIIVGGVVVMWDSAKTGIGWAIDGPEAGYFPFYCALIMTISSVVTLISNLVTKIPDRSNFVERSGLKMVLIVLVPTIIYAWAMEYIGIYVASAIFIAGFMTFLGKYKPYLTIPISLGVPAFMFMMFEIWFLVPLPKGPLERALGF